MSTVRPFSNIQTVEEGTDEAEATEVEFNFLSDNFQSECIVPEWLKNVRPGQSFSSGLRGLLATVANPPSSPCFRRV